MLYVICFAEISWVTKGVENSWEARNADPPGPDSGFRKTVWQTSDEAVVYTQEAFGVCSFLDPGAGRNVCCWGLYGRVSVCSDSRRQLPLVNDTLETATATGPFDCGCDCHCDCDCS